MLHNNRLFRFSLPLFIATLLIGAAGFFSPVHADSYTVTALDASINDGDSQCSLKEAIENVNAQAVLHADCEPDFVILSVGENQINLPANSTITVDDVYTDTGNLLPPFTQPLHLVGNSSTVRIIMVDTSIQIPPKKITIGLLSKVSNVVVLSLIPVYLPDQSPGNNQGNPSNVKLVIEPGQSLTLEDSTISGFSSDSDGGAILNTGNLTLINSQVISNTSAGNGGGIANLGTLTLISSTISYNSANDGGGIANSGIVSATNSIVSANIASHFGGGFISSGEVNLFETIIADNEAQKGDDIYNKKKLKITGLPDPQPVMVNAKGATVMIAQP